MHSSYSGSVIDGMMERIAILTKAFTFARSFRTLILAAIGVILTSVGFNLIAFIFVPVQTETINEIVITQPPKWTNEIERYPWDAYEDSIDPFSPPVAWDVKLGVESRRSVGLQSAIMFAIEPYRCFSFPIRYALSPNPDYFVVCLTFVWITFVWSWIGGAIGRIVCLRFAIDREITIVEALIDVGKKYFSYLGTVYLPIVPVGLILLAIAIFGWLFQYSYFEIVAGLFWIVSIFITFIAMIVLLGLAFGWNLMFHSVSMDASGPFDAISQIYGYLIYRPFRYLGYLAFSILYQGFLAIFINAICYWTVALSYLMLSKINGAEKSSLIHRYLPHAGGWNDDFSFQGPIEAVQYEFTTQISMFLVGFWFHLLLVLLVAYAYSYFWSSSSLIYVILRKDIEEREYTDIGWLPKDSDRLPTVLPVVTQEPTKQ